MRLIHTVGCLTDFDYVLLHCEVRLRVKDKFLTLSENRISCVPTMIDDGKQ